ncbi:hypothetical protein MRX96_002565 [Rhipicephalus microplus]
MAVALMGVRADHLSTTSGEAARRRMPYLDCLAKECVCGSPETPEECVVDKTTSAAPFPANASWTRQRQRPRSQRWRALTPAADTNGSRGVILPPLARMTAVRSFDATLE